MTKDADLATVNRDLTLATRACTATNQLKVKGDTQALPGSIGRFDAITFAKLQMLSKN
ncbi:MAG: hypothetical protein KTR18_15800 [Acidiferrobacterales bacterium]|nr:hypothetical protein [Acidiferrobacterales bacterium]